MYFALLRDIKTKSITEFWMHAAYWSDFYLWHFLRYYLFSTRFRLLPPIFSFFFLLHPILTYNHRENSETQGLNIKFQPSVISKWLLIVYVVPVPHHCSNIRPPSCIRTPIIRVLIYFQISVCHTDIPYICHPCWVFLCAVRFCREDVVSAAEEVTGVAYWWTTVPKCKLLIPGGC